MNERYAFLSPIVEAILSGLLGFIQGSQSCPITLFHYSFIIKRPLELVYHRHKSKLFITLFTSITLFCGTDSTPQNILHIQIEGGKYSVEYCQSHRTLLWIWIMLCCFGTYFLWYWSLLLVCIVGKPQVHYDFGLIKPSKCVLKCKDLMFCCLGSCVNLWMAK